MPQILAEIFDTAFIVTDDVNSNMTTKVIMSAVNRIRPDILANEATTGRRLQQHFGERLKTGRPNGITAYNLAFAGSKPEITSIATK